MDRGLFPTFTGPILDRHCHHPDLLFTNLGIWVAKILDGCTHDLKFVFWSQERDILGLDWLPKLGAVLTLRSPHPLPVSIVRRTQTGICGLISCLCLRISQNCRAQFLFVNLAASSIFPICKDNVKCHLMLQIWLQSNNYPMTAVRFSVSQQSETPLVSELCIEQVSVLTNLCQTMHIIVVVNK